MSIQVGEKIPESTLTHMGADGPAPITTGELFAGKKVVLFAVPGAFTPTCSQAHLPGYVVNADAILAKSVDTIACMAVNDVFVMDAWGKAQNVEDKILMLADGNADFTRALGLDNDFSSFGMGVRAGRFAFIAEDGVVTHLNSEALGKFEISDAETILSLL